MNSPNAARELLLAGDIGATKTTLALYDEAPPASVPLVQQTWRNADVADFDTLLGAFLTTLPAAVRPGWVCIGVAGPIQNGSARMTNLNWLLEEDALQQRHQIGLGRVHLINDLLATAMGAVALPETDLQTLNPGHAVAGAAIAVLAPGTGLGEAFLVRSGKTWLSCPSEGGHASFAPTNAEQSALLTFMQQRLAAEATPNCETVAPVSVEQVCSGLALPNLFAFLAQRLPVPPWLATELSTMQEQGPVLIRAAQQALAGSRVCPIALELVRLLLDILADEAANFALKILAQGGLFLGGGLAPRLLPFLDQARFMTRFARGVHHDWLSRIPIRVINNPQCALLGAAIYGSRQRNRHSEL